MKGLDFSFNYSIADIRDPNKRSTNYSKTIKCPSTKNNDALFGQIWSVNISNNYNVNATNIETNFNPNKKAQALVVQDGVTVMSGVVQLRAITVQNDVYNYEVVFIGNLKTLFSELGDKELNGFELVNGNRQYYIDLLAYDHELNMANQVNSWSAPIGDGYVYPMVDLGKHIEYNGDGYREYRVDDFRPSIYIKTIFDKIFNYAGFTYTSNFINGSFFNSLCMLVDQPMLSSEVANTRKFKSVKKIANFQSIHRDPSVNADGFGNEAVFLSNGIMPKVCFEDESVDGFDVNDQYNLISNQNFLAGESGNYTFKCQQSERNDVFRASLDLRLIKNNSVANNFYNGFLQIVKEDTLGNIEVVGETFWSWDLNTIPVGSSQTKTVYVEGETISNFDDQVYVRMDASDLFGYDASWISPTVKLAYVIENGYFENEPIVGEVFEGDTVKLSDHLPDIQMSDFLISIFKMFNLFVTVNPLNENDLLIETRDEFYSAGTTKDWTYKLARDQKIKIQPLGLLTGQKYIYTYKSDDDYYNERYQSSNNLVYGSRKIEIDNDFINKTEKVEVVFSPSPLTNDSGTSRIIPKIYDSDIDEGAKPTDINVRILYYGGLLTSDPKWVHVQADGVTVERDEYPYAGHWDNPYTPTVDINFGLTNEIYYSENPFTGQLQVTNANLYNIYHKKSIDEISNKDSKVMNAQFRLNPLDIQKLDFRDQILIDNSYWRINKVSDYNPFKEGLTKVELFRVGDVFNFEAETAFSGSNVVVGESSPHEISPVKKGLLKKNRNVYPEFNGKVIGVNNNVGLNSVRFHIVGSNNKIGTNTKNVSILGNGNKVSSNIENVVIINSDNQEVTESNTTIIDGKRIWQYVSIDSDYTANDRDFVLADATSGAITVTLPAVSADIWVAVKKTDASANAVTISVSAAGLIDGSASVILNSQYDAVDVYSDGTNWHIR